MIDISILNKTPDLTEKIELVIQPLAPLSMVDSLPGSHYKTLTNPSKKMICGLFENMLGWHFDINDRMKIEKDLKKQNKNFISCQNGSTYIPLLMEYFEIESIQLPEYVLYNDLWKRAYRRSDADVHPKGTPNIDYELISEKADNDLLTLFKTNIGKFPLYYSTPTPREYALFKGNMKLTIWIDTVLYKDIQNTVNSQNCLYLGNSESWINLEINDYE